jgi:hypothetical protein
VGIAVYALSGLIFPSATIFFAFMAGLVLGNPPGAVTWVISRTIISWVRREAARHRQ